MRWPRRAAERADIHIKLLAMRPHKDQEDAPALIRSFLVPADDTKLRCVDERFTGDQTNGVQVQGATSGLVDAYKRIRNVSEDEAWKAMIRAGIPIDGHDDMSQGSWGCGYNGQVELDPSSVGAPDSTSAAGRLGRVEDTRRVRHEGLHEPAYAAINFVLGTTLDTNRILTAGRGTFNLDAWAVEGYAGKLGLSKEERGAFQQHIIDSYKRTITVLTNAAITTFVEVHR